MRCSGKQAVTITFGEHTVGARWTPYLVFGVGGITARLKNADSTFISGGGFIRNPLYVNAGSAVQMFIPNPAPVRVLDNNDTFFTFSYGGGFKALKVAGPLGFRVDVRGRTIPNFFGDSATFAEFTGGLAFGQGRTSIFEEVPKPSYPPSEHSKRAAAFDARHDCSKCRCSTRVLGILTIRLEEPACNAGFAFSRTFFGMNWVLPTSGSALFDARPHSLSKSAMFGPSKLRPPALCSMNSL